MNEYIFNIKNSYFQKRKIIHLLRQYYQIEMSILLNYVYETNI